MRPRTVVACTRGCGGKGAIYLQCGVEEDRSGRQMSRTLRQRQRLVSQQEAKDREGGEVRGPEATPDCMQRQREV